MFVKTFASFGLAFNYWVVIIALALLVVAYFAYFRTIPSVSGPLKVLLMSLRAAVFLVIVFLLFDPRCIRQSDQTDPGKVIALIDRSASMSLPSEGWEASTARSRFDAALALSGRLKEAVTDRGGVFQEVFFSSKLVFSSSDSLVPDGQGTNIALSLVSAYEKYEGENISAFVLISDGIETEKQLIRRSLPPAPVFAVGVGDTVSPDDVRIKDVSYTNVVRTPSRATIGASLFYTGDREKSIKLKLIEGNVVVFEKDSVISSISREVKEEIHVDFPQAGRRHFLLEVDVEGYDAEEENNRREIVIEAEKAEAKILIVDLKPEWELHFLTELLRRDESFDFKVISLEGRSSPPLGKIYSPNQFLSHLEDCDALVLGSVSENFLNQETTVSIERFIKEKGGGLLVLPGHSSLFSLRGAWQRLEGLFPVRGTPPVRFNIQYTSLSPGAQAGTNPITSQLLPLLGQRDWQERSPLLGFHAPLILKSGAEVLLLAEERNIPAVSYHTVGKGRVAVVSAGPLWRWKFLSDGNTVYDEIMSRFLDVLARGEETERFFLTAKKNVFDAGENLVFIAEVFNKKMQPVTGIPLKIEVSKLDDSGVELPLERVSMHRESVQGTRFRAVVPHLPPGRYLVRGEAELPERTITSRPVEVSVSSVSVEFQQVQQDRRALAAIARRTGGRYGNAEDLTELVEEIPLLTRHVELVSELSVRTSVIAFIIVLFLLSVEWIIRKRAGMI